MSPVTNLSQWLRQLITALLLAGVIEMLIPENGLKKPVKLVIGLLIMTMLIQPLAGLFKVSIDLDRIISSNRNFPNQTGQEVIKRGLEIRNRWRDSNNSRQYKLVQEKIESIIGLIDEIDLKEVRFLEQSSGPDRALIRIAPTGGKKFSKTDQNKFALKVRNSVRLVHNFANEQIEVIWVENQ